VVTWSFKNGLSALLDFSADADFELPREESIFVDFVFPPFPPSCLPSLSAKFMFKNMCKDIYYIIFISPPMKFLQSIR